MIASDTLSLDRMAPLAGPLPPGLDPQLAPGPHHRWKAAQQLRFDAAWQVTQAADALVLALAGIEARRERILLPLQGQVRALAAGPRHRAVEPARRRLLAALRRLQESFALADLLVGDQASTLRANGSSSGLLNALCGEIDEIVACTGPFAGQFSDPAG